MLISRVRTRRKANHDVNVNREVPHYFFSPGDHRFWLLFQIRRECVDAMISLFRIIPSILLPGVECLEYIPSILKLE